MGSSRPVVWVTFIEYAQITNPSYSNNCRCYKRLHDFVGKDSIGERSAIILLSLTPISRLPCRVVLGQTSRQRCLNFASTLATLLLVYERVVDTPHQRAYWAH